MQKMPTWNPPKDIAEALEEGDGFWEDESWAPIRVTAMSGTEFEGRDIPVAWQMEFDPSDEEFEASNARLEDLDIEPDGYGWGNAIAKSIRKTDSTLAKRLHLTDCETDTCVIWVESEQDFRVLLETTWKLITEE